MRIKDIFDELFRGESHTRYQPDEDEPIEIPNLEVTDSLDASEVDGEFRSVSTAGPLLDVEPVEVSDSRELGPFYPDGNPWTEEDVEGFKYPTWVSVTIRIPAGVDSWISVFPGAANPGPPVATVESPPKLSGDTTYTKPTTQHTLHAIVPKGASYQIPNPGVDPDQTSPSVKSWIEAPLRGA